MTKAKKELLKEVENLSSVDLIMLRVWLDGKNPSTKTLKKQRKFYTKMMKGEKS